MVVVGVHETLDLAREWLYRFLAAALLDPSSPRWRSTQDEDVRRLAYEAAELLREEAGDETALGFGEVPPDRLDLSTVTDALAQGAEESLTEYVRVFGLTPAPECMPYETEYHPNAEPFFRAQQMADVAAFYRAFGLGVSRSTPERPDYLPLELEFMAFLLARERLARRQGVAGEERVQVCHQAQQAFFRDHLAWWVPSFATGLQRKAGGGLYGDLGEVLAAFLPLERQRYEVPPPRVPLQTVPAEPAGEAACEGCPGA